MDGKRKITTTEPAVGLNSEKRQKLGADIGPPPLPEGPLSVKQLFTFITDPAIVAFNVATVPVDIVNRIIEPLLRAADNDKLQAAVNVSASPVLHGCLMSHLFVPLQIAVCTASLSLTDVLYFPDRPCTLVGP